jgi:hypothetical protein
MMLLQALYTLVGRAEKQRPVCVNALMQQSIQLSASADPVATPPLAPPLLTRAVKDAVKERDSAAADLLNVSTTDPLNTDAIASAKEQVKETQASLKAAVTDARQRHTDRLIADIDTANDRMMVKECGKLSKHWRVRMITHVQAQQRCATLMVPA